MQRVEYGVYAVDGRPAFAPCRGKDDVVVREALVASGHQKDSQLNMWLPKPLLTGLLYNAMLRRACRRGSLGAPGPA